MKKKEKRATTEANQGSWDELTKLARIVAVPIALKQLQDLANTGERKAIWASCSGKLTREQIASKSGASLRTVKTFVGLAMTYGLLEEEKGKGGHPRRVIDYVPSDWKNLVKKKQAKKKKQEVLEKKD
jgi:hypothetical protein